MQTIFGVLFLLLGVRSLDTDKYEATEPEVEDGSDDADGDAAALEEADLRKMFRWFDADKDGRASLDEIMQFSTDMRQKVASADAHTVMDEMDKDNSKTLSLQEVEAGVAQWSKSLDMKELEADAEEDASAKSQRLEVERAKFHEADSDKNGVLDAPEMPGYFYPETNPSVLDVMTTATMKEKDRNGDGKLSLNEFWGVDLLKGSGEGDVEDDADGKDEQESEQLQEGGVTSDEKLDFKMLDLNKDKYLGLDELRAWESGEFHTREAMRKMIEAADQDHDMHITADELVKAREKIAGMDAQYSLAEWIEQDDMLAEL